MGFSVHLNVQLKFYNLPYQKCDFRVVGVDQNFFTIHYDKEITENGLVLRDMIRLRKVLK